MEEVWFMLECANLSQISGLAVEEMLHKIWDLADSAKYLLDELDYFRIHNLVLNARHASKAVAKLKCLPGGCMPKLGKLIPCSSSAHVHDDNSGQSTLCGVPCGGYAGAPVLRFNTVHFSERMSFIIEQLQPVRKDVKDLIESCGQRTVIDDQIRPITTPQTTEPKLYGRDHIMNTIIHDMTKGNYRDKRLTVLPVVGPGGIGKTTLIQHIYCNQEVKKHFPVMIWICVSASFNLNKVLEKIKDSIPEVGGEEESRSNGLIKQRFLLVLDDIWIISDADDWERLLLTLKTSQENGSMVVVTTRFPSISRMVGTTRRLIELEGLETEEFRKLFLKFVFGKEKCGRDHGYLLATGDEIVDKLNGSPLAANIVGRLLRNDLNLHHWKMVLQSKEWERQAAIDDLIPILKHSYVQRYVSCCALFPIDFRFRSSQIMNLWLGLDILPSGAQAFEYLNKLVAQGLFREEETNGCTCYVMSDLVHDLVLQVASHECLTLHRSNAGSVDIPSSIRHLSIIIDDDNAVSDESFKTELRKLKTRLKVRHLQTLMLFREMDESFANIFGDLIRDANALRVLHLHDVSYHVESILHNFSTLVHLRYLFLGTKIRGLMHRYPVSFKHLKCVQVLDLYGCEGLDNSAMVDICLMIKLKYLSLKQTQVTDIPPEITKLQRLKALDVSQTQISNLPPEISKLQNLETLDVRHTLVKELPKEVLQLPKVKHLHFGQSGCIGVKLPLGINQLKKSVQVMGTVDSRGCSESSIKEISKLIEIRELEVVLYDGPADMERNDKLLSSVGKCSKLKSLTIYGDSNPSDKLASESPNFPKLEKLKVAGRFVKVPRWIGELSALTLLVIRVWKLEENDLVIIGGLPYLCVLELALVALPRKQVTITSSTGFAELEDFCFDCRVPWVSFGEKAMPNLKNLKLQLYSGPADKVPSGIMLLERLNMVTLMYSSQYAASDGVFETVAVVREDAASHANLIKLSINGDREIFPSNRSAERGVAGAEFDTSVSRVITEAEIEEVLALD